MAIKQNGAALTYSGAESNVYGWSTMQSNGINVAAYIYEKGEEGTPVLKGAEDVVGVRFFWNAAADPGQNEFGLRYAEKDGDTSTQIIKIPQDSVNFIDQKIIAQFPENIKSFLGIEDKRSAEPSRTSAPDDVPSVPAASESGVGGIQQFLADHVPLYYRSIPQDALNTAKNPSQQYLDDRILSPGKGGAASWGPASKAALAGFAALIEARASSAAVKDLSATSFENISAGISKIKDGDYTSWEGAITINGANFPGNPQGLLDFLKFAWVATHPPGQSGYDAAIDVDLNLSYGDDQEFPKEGTLHRALAQMLAISPVPFVVVKGPGNGVIPADSSIEIEADGTTNTVKFNQEFPYGAMLGIGIGPDDKVDYPGGKLSADIHSAVAQAVVAGQTATITLTLADGKKFKSNPITMSSMGSTVSFESGAGPAEKAPAAPDATALSGQSSQQVNTREGVTEGGTTPAFEMQNVFVSKNGSPALRRPQVVLRKRVGPANDIFELSVREPSRDYILVPIEIRGPLSEAVTHWTQAVLGASVATSGAGQPHVALQKIEWGYKGHFRKYGSGGVAEIILVSYEPSEVTKFPNDVNVISIDQALRQGSPGGAGRDPVEQAIAMYIGSDSNPTGTSIYLSSDLNREMNSFAPARYRTG